METAYLLSKRQLSATHSEDKLPRVEIPIAKNRSKDPFECIDYIEFNQGNPIPKGGAVSKFTHLFYDSNTFYMKFLGFSSKRGIKIHETQSIEGITKILDIHYDGVICRGRSPNQPNVRARSPGKEKRGDQSASLCHDGHETLHGFYKLLGTRTEN